MSGLDGPLAGQDVFDEILGLESEWEKEGRKDGLKDGALKGTNWRVCSQSPKVVVSLFMPMHGSFISHSEIIGHRDSNLYYLLAGEVEGRAFGVDKGRELGIELGYYAG